MTQTAQKIYNRALFYLQRYSATEKHLATILNQQLQRKARKGEVIPPEAAQWVEATVQKCVTLGLVNDRTFAESRINTLRRQGRSASYIKQHLTLKGVSRDLVATLFGEPDAEDERAAASRFVERRRLGRDTSAEARQKDLAKLMRAGFDYRIAKEALDS